jgi:hypothetical protein
MRCGQWKVVLVRGRRAMAGTTAGEKAMVPQVRGGKQGLSAERAIGCRARTAPAAPRAHQGSTVGSVPLTPETARRGPAPVGSA